MKKLYFFIILLGLSNLIFAQDSEVSTDVKGTLYLLDGTSITGDFIVKFRDGYVPPKDEFGNVVNLDAGKEAEKIVYYYPYKKRFKYNQS